MVLMWGRGGHEVVDYYYEERDEKGVYEVVGYFRERRQGVSEGVLREKEEGSLLVDLLRGTLSTSACGKEMRRSLRENILWKGSTKN